MRLEVPTSIGVAIMAGLAEYPEPCSGIGPPLTVTVLRKRAVSVIEIWGELRLDTAHIVLAAGMKELAEEPAGLMLDVAGMELGDELGVTVISTLARRAARDPGIRVVLARPAPALRQQMRRWGTGFVDAFDTTADARQALQEDPQPREFTTYLPFDPRAAGQARLVVEHACAAWGLPDLAEDARQIASELVTNAVKHSVPELELQITRRNSLLHIRVADGTSEAPVLLGPAANRQRGGLGLIVVDALSAHWGCRSTPTGKIVWATLRADL
jgi:anti-sigma regulatory factor (Ser/Thr protein kinase)